MGFGLVYVVDMIILIGEAKSGGGKSCERAKEYPYSSSTGAVAAEMHDISSIALEAPIYLHALQYVLMIYPIVVMIYMHC